jgi:hypothetical protein
MGERAGAFVKASFVSISGSMKLLGALIGCLFARIQSYTTPDACRHALALRGADACQHVFTWQSRQTSKRVWVERNVTMRERASARGNAPLASI